jgi:acetyl-CoA/propionyl-CoA carboxylase, biotin carboxylase, biotin carboxyl carrier protein
MMFDTVLVANRGEIACRVLRTLRALGIRSVAVYSDADADAPHVHLADVAVRLGPAPAAQSYLSIERIVAAARATGAQAVHPGYGFLSENAAFAAACAAAGVVFVGPRPSAIAAMGDKIEAKRTVAAAGVAVVPGSEGALADDELARVAGKIGYPVLLKPSAGGGGKGMREVHGPAELAGAIAAARREACGAFGDDTLLVERLVATPRHVEIQVLADAHGTVVHLGERECSLQRRHQKIVEEAPSPLLAPEQRERMGEAACAVARAVGYTGAGTVEFVVGADRPDEFFFLEMNTRLQVEHPVTEMITGLDLVELQLRVAAGDELPLRQRDVVLRGHAVEARVYAEDPSAGFLPTGGRVVALAEPAGPGIRVDSGIALGTVVGSDYDPLLAKVVAHGADRDDALRQLDAALARTVVLGVGANVGFLRALLADDDVRAGRLDTGLVGRRLADLAPDDIPDDVLSAAAGCALLDLEPVGDVVDPFDVPGGWRLGAPAWTTYRLAVAARASVEVRCRGRAGDAEISLDGAPAEPTSTRATDGGVVHTRGGVSRTYRTARDADGVLWLGREGHAHAVRASEPLEAGRAAAAAGDGQVRSPMPGTVAVVAVTEGQEVTAGQALVVVEAMKMEHVLTAPVEGVVRALRARSGEVVAKDAPLLRVEPLLGVDPVQEGI